MFNDPIVEELQYININLSHVKEFMNITVPQELFQTTTNSQITDYNTCFKYIFCF